MSKIINFEEAKERLGLGDGWTVSVVICLKCLKRWVCMRPRKTLLKDLDCDVCGNIQSVIETGQELHED